MSYCIFSFCSRSALRFPRNHLVSTDNSAPILLNDPLKIFSLSFLGFKTGFHRRLMEGVEAEARGLACLHNIFGGGFD
ncbi:Uncharacterized protein TCM_034466 [Theobroma cacao]|uniref:Uncharacterized protein n=1 Tax=Theobroma cacao TaxID=3641 RepID=A0A061FF85_THECC|nr:Uncharacterized protein TCM_034466 [Theobroma cacao]